METISFKNTQKKTNFHITYIPHKTKQWVLNKKSLPFIGQYQMLMCGSGREERS